MMQSLPCDSLRTGHLGKTFRYVMNSSVLGETDDGEVGRVVKIDNEKRVVNIDGKERNFPLDYWLYIQERPSLNALGRSSKK